MVTEALGPFAGARVSRAAPLAYDKALAAALCAEADAALAGVGMMEESL